MLHGLPSVVVGVVAVLRVVVVAVIVVVLAGFLLQAVSLSVSSSHSCVPATPTYKESICFAAKMEIDTFSTTTISTLAIFLYAMLRF